jgi:hypothetical protein
VRVMGGGEGGRETGALDRSFWPQRGAKNVDGVNEGLPRAYKRVGGF